MIKLVKERIAQRLPDNIEPGIEMHYYVEVDEKTLIWVYANWLYGGKICEKVFPSQRGFAEHDGEE